MYSRTGYARLSAIAQITTASTAARLVSRARSPPGGRTSAGVIRPCLVESCRRERQSGGMPRQAEEEPIAELLATTTTPRGALRGPRSRLDLCETWPTALVSWGTLWHRRRRRRHRAVPR